MAPVEPAHHLDLATFGQLHPTSHVVVGVVSGSFAAPDFAALRRHLRRLIESLAIEGDYATGLVRTAESTEIHCMFERAEDADRLDAWMKERFHEPTGRWQFVIDDEVRQALRMAASPTNGRRRA
ncbi:MAG: hypothetical protein ACOY4R_14290 [Pseudomonadota bacterium]